MDAWDIICNRITDPTPIQTQPRTHILAQSWHTKLCQTTGLRRKENGRRKEKGGRKEESAAWADKQSEYTNLSAWTACNATPASKASDGKTTVAPWHGTCRHPSTMPKQWYSGTGMQIRVSWNTRSKNFLEMKCGLGRNNVQMLRAIELSGNEVQPGKK